ncbi:hypothetical protein N234_35370 [Ralstonia pickettii DTP0602]|nr:hypothetical protein N234_35370 [Ralstonia pickettii DTP0602]
MRQRRPLTVTLLVDAARVASPAAALSTQGYGAVDPLPRRTQVEAVIASMIAT